MTTISFNQDLICHHRARKAVAWWLSITAAMVFLMVVIGGVTRLTGSGLSIVEWKPMVGAIPPLSSAAWEGEFDKYKAHSEYKKMNTGMTLGEFKLIYGLEYFHRLWGRLIGLVLGLPLLIFAARRWVTHRLILHCSVTFALGGFQGLMGWVMVKSGLGADPHVSPIKLVLHLLLASLILWRLIWAALSVLGPRTLSLNWAHSSPFPWLTPLALLTFVYGGLVAGHKAGLIYNTFPLMGGQWVPDEIFHLSPFWNNFFLNPVTVQFMHRALALFLLISLAVATLRWKGGEKTKRWLKACLHLTLIQVGLGIATLLCHVPVTLGTLHQGVGMLLLQCMLLGLYRGPDSASSPAR